jgi:transcriptional regulator of acetoin/glycerol metabolism
MRQSDDAEEMFLGSMTNPLWSDSAEHAAESSVMVRPAIARSWRRSSLHGIDRGIGLVHSKLDINLETEFHLAATPVLDNLGNMLGVPALVVLSDADGRLIKFCSPHSSVLRRFENIGAYPGVGAGEGDVGTNAIGTALEEGRPMVVTGREHYQQNFEQITCAAGVVRNPLTKRTIGSIALAALDSGSEREMLQYVVRASRAVEQRLLERATRADRLVLEALKVRGGGAHRRVLGVSRDMIMANEPGTRLLSSLNEALIWEWARETVETGRARTLEVVVSPGCEPVHVDVVPVGDDVTDGALIDFGCASANPRRQKTAIASEVTEPADSERDTGACQLVGHSRQARYLADRITSAARSMRAALITGETGAGKAAAARALLLQRFPQGEPIVVDCWDPKSTERWAASDNLGAPVLFTHVELLDIAQSYRLRDMLRRSPELQRCSAFTLNTVNGRAAETSNSPLVEELGGLTVEVPPLRYRRDDIIPFLEYFCAQSGASSRRFGPEAVQLMLRYLWPGNVGELKSVVQGAIEAKVGHVELADLPKSLCRAATRRPLTPLEQAEADAILAAMRSCGNNKVQAAAMLQISRSRLYRKVSAYGLAGVVLG